MSTKILVKYFLIWRILLFVFLFLSIGIIPLQFNFLGGGLTNYLETPHFWAWANFDGEHYLDISRTGYKPFTFFYFPLYPLLIRFLASLTNKSFINYLFSGFFVSNISFLIGLIGLVRLVRLDYDERITFTTILLILFFPTSFYFGSIYTESLFFALLVWSFYFARVGKWILAGILGAFLTSTRIVGLALFPAFIIEAISQWRQRKVPVFWPIVSSFWVLLGIFFYTIFLDIKTGDPLEFFKSVSIFGEQRGSNFIFLPQVFYRYIFKIIPIINYSYFPVVFTTWLEFLVASLFLILVVIALFTSFKKSKNISIRPSYAVYLLIGFLMPTLSGSFSSLPRYVLVLFPAFIVLSHLILKFPQKLIYLIYFLTFLGLAFATSLFVRGYWVS